MPDFTIAYKITVVGNEGGYDPGTNEAETYRGIDRGMNPKWAGWPLIDAIRKGNASLTVKQLNTILAGNAILQTNIQHFYKAGYWDVLKLDQVKDQQLANNFFDCSVNPCIDAVGIVMQQACYAVKAGALKMDGIVGPATISCINSLPGKDLFLAMNAIRLSNYMYRAKISPDKKGWLPDWLKRLIAYV